MGYPNLKKTPSFAIKPSSSIISIHGNTILCVTYSLLPAVVEGLLPVGQKVGVPAIPKLFGERPLLSCETCCFTLITYLKLFDLLIIERQFSHFSNYPNQTNPRRSKPPEKSLATETWWNMIPTKKDRLQHGLLKRTFFDRLWQRKLRMHPDRHHGSEIESLRNEWNDGSCCWQVDMWMFFKM